MQNKTNFLPSNEELKKHRLLYPDERIVTFLSKYFKDFQANSHKNALDIGFGSGRHLKILLDYGFQVSGIDFSQEALNLARKYFNDTPNLRELKQADIQDSSLQKGVFDVIIAWGLVFLFTQDNIIKNLGIINSLLADGGKFICNFRSKNNWFYGKGKQLEKNIFMLNADAGPYEDMLYGFFDLNEALQLMDQANFSVINSEYVELKKNNLTETHSWWVFHAEKK